MLYIRMRSLQNLIKIHLSGLETFIFLVWKLLALLLQMHNNFPTSDSSDSMPSLTDSDYEGEMELPVYVSFDNETYFHRATLVQWVLYFTSVLAPGPPASTHRENSVRFFTDNCGHFKRFTKDF